MRINFRKLQKEGDKIMSGDRDAIMRGFSYPGSVLRVDSIRSAVRHRITDSDIVGKIVEMKNDDAPGFEFLTVSDFAVSALHILGIEEYTGNDEDILRLIKDNAFAG